MTAEELAGLDDRDLLRRLFAEDDVRMFRSAPVFFRCRCSRARVANMLRALGCQVVLTEAAKGMKGAVQRAEEIAAQLGGKAWMPKQFDNPANPDIH